jgi:hypothetical protein
MRNGPGHGLSRRGWGTTALVLTCSASAGAHAGLVPSHLDAEPRLGAAFLIAVVLLLGAAIALAARPADVRITSAAGLLLVGLMLSYLATRTIGIPWLDPKREAPDAVGIATSGIEALGVLTAVLLLHPCRRHVRRTHLQEVSR